MTQNSSSLETLKTARKYLDLILSLTREETFARAQEDTLRADRCYHLRQMLLETWSEKGVPLDGLQAFVGAEDPCVIAERILTAR